MTAHYRILFSFLIALSSFIASAQSKLSVTITNPSEIHLCILSDEITIEIRNITTTTVSGIECELDLPTGITYEAGSLNSSTASEKNISNLSKPVFSISNLGLAQASVLKIKVNTACSIASFLNNGGLATIKSTTIYSGGSVVKNSSPLNVKQPSIQIASITNQLYTADKNDVFIREITIKNSGTGKVKGLGFNRIYGSGLTLTGTSPIYTLSGDTMKSYIDSALWTTVGNNDGFFDLNETFIIRDTIRVDECSGLTAKYSAFFGCNGDICEIKNANANVSISTKSPDLRFTASNSTTNCVGSGDMHEHRLVIYNAGNDTARAVRVHLFQSSGTGFTTNVLSKFDTSSFKYSASLVGNRIKVKPFQVTTTTNTGFFSCLGSDPIGEVSLNLQNIAPGDSMVLTWDMSTCCPDVCSGTVLYNQRWKYDASYKNQCGNNLYQNEVYGYGGRNQYLRVTKFGPTDIKNGQTRQLEYTITQGYFMTPRSSSQFQLELILPSGVKHSGSTSDVYFTHANGTSWYPNYITQNGDTTIAHFNGNPTVTITRSELLVNIIGDCSNSSSNGTLNYKVNFKYNPDTTCSNNCYIPMYCDNDDIRVHCGNTCSAGMYFNGFETQRISYGQPDNDNDGKPDASGTLDMGKVKSHRVMYGDTVLAVFKGKVYNGSGSGQSNWRYGKAISTLDFGRYLSVAEVTVKIYRVGNLLFNCNNIGHTYTTSGNSRTFTFDISYNSLVNAGCVLYSTFAYLNVDSVEVHVKYVVDQNPGGAVRDLNFTNSFYLSPNANPSSSQQYQCDNFSSRISLIGYYFTNYGKNTFKSTGCNTIGASQNFYLSIGNCCANYGGGNIFPYEYRPWAKLNEIFVKKPEGFDVLRNRIIQYRTAGTGATATELIDTIYPSYSSPTELKFKADSFYSDLGGPMEVSDDGFHGTYTTYLRPNCKAVPGLSEVEYGFVFEKLGSLGSGLDTLFTTTQNDELDYYPPLITTTLKNNNIYADKDTVTWDLQLSNAALSSDASYFWFTGSNDNNAVIVDIIDVSTNTAVPKQNDLFLIGNVARLSQKDYRIVATYTDCFADSIALEYGFDCNGYPDSSELYPCDKKRIMLYFEPINTRLETTIIDTLAEVDLCAERPYTVSIRNTGSPKVFNTYLDILARPGMTMSDTSWLFIDGRSDSIMITAPTYIGSSTYRWWLSAADSLFNANGLNGVSSSDGYLMQLKFTVKTDCDFTSASSFLVRAGGFLKCGDPVNARFNVSDPFHIKGITKPYFASVRLAMNKLDVCNYDDSTRISFINLGPDTTGITDKIIMALPWGITVDTTYIDANHNAPTTAPGYDVVNGENTYSWTIPSGISAGDSVVFYIKTMVDDQELECGVKQIFTQSVISQSVMCVEDSSFCDINVATASVMRSDTVEKNGFNLTFNGATSIPLGTNDQVNLSYTLTNTGTDKAAGDLLITSVYYDQNQNGIVDTGDVWVASDSIYSTILNGNSLSRAYIFDVASNYTCNLLLQISDSNCVCDQTIISIPYIQLKNAGNDTIACAGIPFIIGSAGSADNTYTWNNSQYLDRSDTSRAVFTGTNYTGSNLTIDMILTTNKGQCSSNDTISITLYPQMSMQMDDTIRLCDGDRVVIGSLVTGGVGRLKTYQWSPTDSLERPTSVKTFAYPSVSTMYTVVVTDDEGCTISDSSYIDVVPAPEAIIGLNDSCAGTLFSFTNNSNYFNSTRDSIHWTIGSLAETTFENPSFVIDSAHTLLVELYTSNNVGCWDTTSAWLTVRDLPQMSLMHTEACEGDSISIWSTSTTLDGALTHSWTIDGTPYTGDSIRVQLPYNQQNIYIELYANSEYGCTAQLLDTISIWDRPEIDITASGVCIGDSVDFETVELSGTVDALTTYTWDVGDGNTYSTSSFKHRYTGAGIYNIILSASNANGCTDSASSSVEVHAKPIAAFSTTNACLGDSNQFTSSYHQHVPEIDSIYWNTGNGFVAGDSALSILETNKGAYSVSQRISTAFGCADTIAHGYWVYHTEIPKLQVTGNCENELITLNSDPQIPDSVASIQWRIDGQDIDDLIVYHDFPSAGTYKIIQTVTTNNGCSTVDSFDVQVDPAPNALIDYDKICLDNEVDFSSSGGQCFWDLGDGSTNTNCAFKHFYVNKGSYPVELIVTNNFNCKDTANELVVIDNIVTPDFDIRDACEEELQWVVHTSYGNGPQIIRATFDMGNGDEIDVLDSFEYAYLTEGTYTISLEIETQSGCIYDTSKTINIYPLPMAGFSIDPEEADIFTADIQIMDESVGADSLAYRISDGTIFTVRDFSHEFPDSGRYTIEQWVTTNYGCMDSMTRELYVSFAFKVFIPNTFTPNDNGLNEVFRPMGIGMAHYEVMIFNRWGELVFESEELDQPWNGEDAIQGYYLYYITAYDYEGNSHYYSGGVYLLR